MLNNSLPEFRDSDFCHWLWTAYNVACFVLLFWGGIGLQPKKRPKETQSTWGFGALYKATNHGCKRRGVVKKHPKHRNQQKDSLFRTSPGFRGSSTCLGGPSESLGSGIPGIQNPRTHSIRAAKFKMNLSLIILELFLGVEVSNWNRWFPLSYHLGDFDRRIMGPGKARRNTW